MKGLYYLASNFDYIFGLGGEFVSLIQSATDNPYYLFATHQHKLTLLLRHRDLAVDKEVAHLLVAVVIGQSIGVDLRCAHDDKQRNEDEAAQDKGIEVILASGRDPQTMRRISKELNK